MTTIDSNSLAVVKLPNQVADQSYSIDDYLPDELILDILARTNKEDVYHFTLAGRATFRFVKDSYLWSLLFLRDFPQRLPVVLPNATNSWKDLYRMPVVTRTNIRHNRAQITALPSHAEKITSLSCRGRLLVTGDTDGTVKVSAKDREGKFQEV
ncbi:MAG TPA: hypothetical protein VIJ14_03970, partial [Rhabdochlamydiaceae bacterium]